MKKQPPMTSVSLETLEATAKILGPSSAAAKALAEAKDHKGFVRFWKSGNTLILEKEPIDKN